ncbi:VOC family protein [uncultured Martelella sp.]|uniref:VOC family protein n=1 Tax=uncultured Martelella sp. TaxID=392331 RepID=UPI0029C6AC6E|nr:VOC family protein [uncultured Martelella sp.]
MSERMIDHMGLPVANLKAAMAFYEKALAPLSMSVAMKFSMDESDPERLDGVAFGAGKPLFWLSPGGPVKPPLHIAFRAETRAEVRAFYDAALAAGATDNGPPGIRPHYHATYYAAFVRDPDGNNIEAVCMKPESEA